MFVNPTPMRHRQLFTYLLLLLTREWPHSEARLTLGKVEMFYHCISSDTSIPITLTRQVTQLALLQATLGSLPTMIPEYPSLDHFIWQPGSPSVQPQQINSCWYVADTPGPAILGLPSGERLEVVKMICAVKVIQDTSHLPGLTPVPPTPKKTAPIKSTEDLIRKFPDRFQGIGQFPGEYIIRLCDDAQPVTHIPQNSQFPYVLKLRQNWTRWQNLVSSPLKMNQQTGSHQQHILGKHLMSYVSVWIFMISIMPFAGTITAHTQWKK